jgi:hypothetical protein
MNRRNFLMTSLAAGASALPALAAESSGDAASSREYYELREYRLNKGPMQKRADDYFRQALLPALHRAGTGPVGVFNVSIGPESPTTYILIPHSSFESAATLQQHLAKDQEYQKSGEPFLSAPASDPPYAALESTLLLAFEKMPRIEVPAGAKERQPRIFELRTYHSHSERAGIKKVEMFNNGEIAIFRRVGLNPVFFGQRIFGINQPSLTYMLTYPDMAARQKAWTAFGPDPEWRKLSTTPGYTDAEIVASISNILLTPASYSEI